MDSIPRAGDPRTGGEIPLERHGGVCVRSLERHWRVCERAIMARLAWRA
jgi:hypothetical protein